MFAATAGLYDLYRTDTTTVPHRREQWPLRTMLFSLSQILGHWTSVIRSLKAR